MIGVYATAWEVTEYLNASDNQSYLVDERRFIRFTIQMSRKFETLINGRHFLPSRETQKYEHPETFWPPGELPRDIFTPLSNTLKLEDDLLALIELKTNNGDTTISSDNILLMTGYSYNYSPKDHIELKRDGTQTAFYYSGTTQEANEVDGIFGYHEDYAQAWQSIDTIQNAGGINAVETSITVVDADAFDEIGMKPRFQEQQILRLGSVDTSEMVYVQTVNYSTNVIQVQRAVNGSTAAVAAKDVAIQVWRPQDEIKHAMLVLATHAYRRKDTIGSAAEGIHTPGGMLIIPEHIPREVADMVKAYKKPFLRST